MWEPHNMYVLPARTFLPLTWGTSGGGSQNKVLQSSPITGRFRAAANVVPTMPNATMCSHSTASNSPVLSSAIRLLLERSTRVMLA